MRAYGDAYGTAMFDAPISQCSNVDPRGHLIAVRAHLMYRIITVAFALMSFSSELCAFQQCPAGTHPCASPSQVLIWVVLPSLALYGFAIFAQQKVQRVWLRRVTVTLLGGLWLFWLLVVLAAFGAFLAQCSGSCWYASLK